MTAAVRREMIPSNPVDIPEAARRPRRAIKELPAQVLLQDIVNELDSSKPRVDGSHKLIAILTFFHGLRIGEALGLRRKDVIRTGDRISVYVRGNCYRVAGQGMIRKPRVKSDAGYRLVPIFDHFTKDFNWHLDTFVGDSDEAMLFTTGSGAIVLDTSYRSILDRAKIRAGYADVKLTPHYGRVWVITALAEAGMPIPAIGEILGQRDLRTITEVYMRATEERKRSVLDSVNAALDKPDGGIGWVPSIRSLLSATKKAQVFGLPIAASAFLSDCPVTGPEYRTFVRDLLETQTRMEISDGLTSQARE